MARAPAKPPTSPTPYPYNMAGIMVNIYTVAIPVIQNSAVQGVVGAEESAASAQEMSTRSALLNKEVVLFKPPNRPGPCPPTQPENDTAGYGGDYIF
ncbi:hypothetical protein LJC60_04615 [Ruminococcaceae bacterium OttesenSCG-928-D13]|nr:hypothetical protein [Ruminococcaceae bacterium OttesenSCG-928-D13]